MILVKKPNKTEDNKVVLKVFCCYYRSNSFTHYLHLRCLVYAWNVVPFCEQINLKISRSLPQAK